MKKIHIFYIVLFSFFTTYKSYKAYDAFIKNNVPVYDGVMYENRQVKSYQRYKGNFSLMERINQVYYEFEGNPTGAGFACAIALINPEWFINDGDILLRSFLAVLIFSLVLFRYLNRRVNPINSLVVITLIFQLPLFYHYQYGLTTYIPDITSALFLMAGYIHFLNYFKSEKTIDFIIAVVLMVVSIMSRFNFFVYAFCFLLPLLYKLFITIKRQPKGELIKILLFSFMCLSFLAFYIFSHLSFFLGYYLSVNEELGTSDTPYAVLTLGKAIQDLIYYFNIEIGIVGFLTLILILFFANKMSKQEKYNKVEILHLVYPFLYFFTFIILVLKYSNGPHIISAMCVFLFSVFLIPLPFICSLINKFKLINIQILAILMFVLLNIQYGWSLTKFSKIQPELAVNKEVVDYIAKDKNLNKNFKYMCFYDEMLNIQLDVSLFNKTKTLLNSENHFFVHDLYLISISPKLDVDECVKHYMQMIDSVKFDLILINKKVNTPLMYQATARKVNREIYQKIVHKPEYFISKTVMSDYHGDVVFFKRKK